MGRPAVKVTAVRRGSRAKDDPGETPCAGQRCGQGDRRTDARAAGWSRDQRKDGGRRARSVTHGPRRRGRWGGRATRRRDSRATERRGAGHRAHRRIRKSESVGLAVALAGTVIAAGTVQRGVQRADLWAIDESTAAVHPPDPQ